MKFIEENLTKINFDFQVLQIKLSLAFQQLKAESNQQ